MYNNIPEELKQLPCWICWQGIKDEHTGKLRKIPIDAKNGKPAKSNDSDTWADFETAVRASEDYSGIGFVFDGSSGYFGVDLDGVGEALPSFLNGECDNIVGEFVFSLQSYTEISQSGNGIHIICKGTLPPGGRRKGPVEMYENGRYFIMTGNSVTDYPVAECSDAIKVLHEKYIGGGSKPAPINKNIPVCFSGNTADVVERIKASKQGPLFSDLMQGKWEQHYHSQSEADMAFCNILAFWFERDFDAIDNMFRSSGLMRDKWDRKQSGSTYGAITIEKAISECRNVYKQSMPSETYTITVDASGETVAKDSKGERVRIYSMDDTGNAQRLFDNYGHRMRFSYLEKNWYYWDERRWCRDNTGTIDRIADDALLVMAEEIAVYKQMDESPESDGKAEKAFRKHITVSRSSKAKSAAKKEFQHFVPVLVQQFDRDKKVLNTPSGIVDLENNKILPHDINKYITKLTGTGISDADCPQWKEFLNTIFAGDKELIRYIQKAVGYSLSGSTSEQCVFFLFGTGRNGKSTFLDTIRAMMGEYASNAQPETIMVSHKTSGSARSDIARLKGARFVTTVEPNEGMRLDEGLIKQLTGGDPVTARFQYSQEFEFTPEFKIWMATNHKPIIRGTDVGIWRRIHLVPFAVQIPENKIDRNLPYKLKKELPAILRWAIDGYTLYRKEGLYMPKVVLSAVEDYRREMDVISAFMSSCCLVGKDEYQVQSNVLYAAYCAWATENNEYKMSHTKFSLELTKKDRIFKEKHNSGIYFKRIKLLPELEKSF